MAVYTAKLNNVRISPRKVRLVANLVKGMSVANAIDQLNYSNKDAGEPVSKVIRSAAANAEHNFQADPKKLKVQNIFVNNGLNYKRGKPVSKGRYHMIIRRGSHITVELTDITTIK